MKCFYTASGFSACNVYLKVELNFNRFDLGTSILI